MSTSVSSNKGWLVTFCGLGINLALGVLYSWSVLSKAIKADWAWTDSQATLPYTVAVGVFAIMMVFAGRAQDKLGPRLVASLGGALTGIGLIIASFASEGNPTLMIIGFGVFAGTGIGLGYASATPAALKWFPPAKRGMISGLVVTGFGLASVYIAPSTEALLKSFGINKTFMFLGIAFFFVTLILAQFLNNPPAGYVPQGSKAPAPTTSGQIKKHDFDWHEMLKTPQFYILWLMYAFVAFAGLMIIGHMAKIAAVQLEGVNLGYLLVAILAIGNASGRLIAGSLSDILGRTKTMLLVFILQAVMMGILASATTTTFLVVAAALIGFFYGANLSLFPSTTADYFGTKNLGVNYGLVFTAWGVGGVFGSMTAAKIFDITQSYSTAYIIAAGLCVAAAVMTFILKQPADVMIDNPAVND